MVSLTEFDNRTHVSTFTASTEADITKLPTTTENGKEELADCEPVVHGSQCIVMRPSAKVFMLDGDTDTWVEFG